MQTLEINLPESLRAFVDAQVDEGAYDNPSAFLEHLVSEAKARREGEIGRLLLEAVNSDKPWTQVTPEFWEHSHAELAKRLDKNSGRFKSLYRSRF